ncbi:hypothetical protein Y1Q_0007790 [Alligator mississippiensis]|uniref:Uncharacterized protein n=1 Tax=Alligator mississippiensis TaxID=8496 RepID=A0A151N6X9_ALLMI|nr:hypothetical protein Y1Q_0007790 [Alligator mississippiensis]
MCINPGQIAVLIMRLNGTIFVFIDMPETLVKWSWTTVCDQGLRLNIITSLWGIIWRGTELLQVSLASKGVAECQYPM